MKPEKVLLEVKDVSVYFPVRRGLMRRVVDHFRAVENVSRASLRGGVIKDSRAKIGVAWTLESYPKLVCKLLLRRIKKFIEIFLLQCT